MRPVTITLGGLLMMQMTWKACHGVRRGAVRYYERCVFVQPKLYTCENSLKSLYTRIIGRKSLFPGEANSQESVT